MNIAERLEQLMENKGINRRQLSLGANIPCTHYVIPGQLELLKKV